MPEKLAACCECKHIGLPHVEEPHVARCSCPDVPPQIDPVYGGKSDFPGVACIQVNHDGHCPHFEPKE